MKKSILKILLPLIICLGFMASNTKEFELSKNLEIFISIVDELNNNYVDEIEPGQIIMKGIKAMLKSLDPYTVYFSESDVENYKVQITGKYGGIGSLISTDSNYVIISEPYKGFPAYKSGMWAGDKIIKIEDMDMENKNTSEVSKLLKGSPNTKVNVLIQRPYENKTRKITITREEIKVNSVPYFALIDSNIAYIKLTKFIRGSGNEVKAALKTLKDSVELKGCILDLRNNSGGLLIEAVNVTNIFIPKGEVVVSTKGKKFEKDYKSLNEAVDTTLPLIVLTNRGSASASEIVSGAIQDLDRGIIVGQRTYGKGLVQNTRSVGYNTQIKLTTAKYYIPSGRCIQELDYANKNDAGNVEKVADSLINAFKTKNQRLVYDGKGIKPDIETDKPTYSKILSTLLRKRHIFKYATFFRFYTDSSKIELDFEVSDSIYNDFLAFIKDKDYSYKTNTEEILIDLEKNTKDEKYFEAVEEDMKLLKEKLLSDKENDIQKFKDEISLYLTQEIITRFHNNYGRINAKLKKDSDIDTSVTLLKNKADFESLLLPK